MNKCSVDNTVVYYILYHLVFLIDEENIRSKNYKYRRKYVHDRISQDLGVQAKASFRLYSNTNVQKKSTRFFPRDDTFRSWHENDKDLHERSLISKSEYDLTFGNSLRITLRSYLEELKLMNGPDPIEFLNSKLSDFGFQEIIEDVTDITTAVDRIVQECEKIRSNGEPTLDISYSKDDLYYQMRFVLNKTKDEIFSALISQELKCAEELLSVDHSAKPSENPVLSIYVDQDVTKYCLDYSGNRAYSKVLMPYEQKAVKTKAFEMLCYSIQRVYSSVYKELQKSNVNKIDIVVSARGKINRGVVVRNENMADYVLVDRNIILRLKMILNIRDDQIMLINDHQATAFANIENQNSIEDSIICTYYLTMNGVAASTIINSKVLDGSENDAGEIANLPYQVKGKRKIYEEAVELKTLFQNLENLGLSFENEEDFAAFNFFDQTIDDEVKKTLDKWISDVVFGLLMLKYILDYRIIYLCNIVFKNPYIYEQILIKFNEGLRAGTKSKGEDIVCFSLSAEPVLDGAINYLIIQKENERNLINAEIFER